MTVERDNSSLPAPVILALDTSSKQPSLAIARGDAIIASFGDELDEKRSERLWTDIDLLLREAGLLINDVDFFSVCVGPGGFTGLRVGIAAAKGFAFASDKPVVGVGSLEAIAFATAQTGLVCSVKSAYRGEVYAQMFTCRAREIPGPEKEPVVLPPADVSNLIGEAGEVVLAGEAAAGVAAALSAGNERSSSLARVTVHPTSVFLAESIARLGYLRFLAGGAGKAEDLRALYVRPSDAEIKLSKGLLGVKRRVDARSD